MITLNNKKFAETEQEFINSVFSVPTCSGYAKRHKRKINLYDHNKNLIGVIANRVLGKTTLMENGKYWYNYADIPLLGDYPYKTQREELYALETGWSSGRPEYK